MKKNAYLTSFGVLCFTMGLLLYANNANATENISMPDLIMEEPLNNSEKILESPSCKTILPNNDRVQITDITQSPYQAACFIYVNNAVQGSGVVVGKNAILTNRHVAASAKNGNPKNIKINVGRTNKSKYKGVFFGEEIRYIPTGQDLAIVFTSPNSNNLNVGDVCTPATFVENNNLTNTILGSDIKVVGYPGDKPWATLWESRGKLVSNKLTNTIHYDASTYGGNSGSPVFNNQNEVIGIHYGGDGKSNGAIRFNSYVYDFIKNNVNPPIQTIYLGGQAVGDYSDNSHDSGFARVTLDVKDHKASLIKGSDYQFHWSGWTSSKYASIKLTDPNGKVMYDQSWKGNESVKGKGYKKFGTFAQYDLPEGSTVEIYHAEGPWHRFHTSNDAELKNKADKAGYTYTYKMQNNQLVLQSVK